MEQRGPLWSRLLSRIRNVRSNRYNGWSRRRSIGRLSSSNFPNWRNPIFTRSSHQERQRQTSQYVYGFNPYQSTSTSVQSYVPKCLTGFCSENVLQGISSYDDFSRNCWLEDRLHLFGRVSRNIADENDDIQSSTGSSLSSFFDLFSEISVNSVRSPRLQNITGEDSSNDNSSNQSEETVSDITNFFNIDFSGISFDPQNAVLMEPPPYSADPPPPYTEELLALPISSQSSLSSASSKVIAQAILW